MLYRLHVNRGHIASNKKHGTSKAVFTAKSYRSNRRGNTVLLRDKKTGALLLKGVYSPDKPLSCGAKVWMEFDDNNVDVEVLE